MKFMRSLTDCDSTDLYLSAVLHIDDDARTSMAEHAHHQSGPSKKSWNGCSPRYAKVGVACTRRVGSDACSGVDGTTSPCICVSLGSQVSTLGHLEVESDAKLVRKLIGSIEYPNTTATTKHVDTTVAQEEGVEHVLLASQVRQVDAK